MQFSFTNYWGDDSAHVDVLLHLNTHCQSTKPVAEQQAVNGCGTELQEQAETEGEEACTGPDTAPDNNSPNQTAQDCSSDTHSDQGGSSMTQPEQDSSSSPQAVQHAKTYSLHALILTAASAYFKARLSSSWQGQGKEAADGGEASSSGATRSSNGSGSGSGAGSVPTRYRHELVEHAEAGEVEAWEHLLRLMYGHPLPHNSSAQQLVQCLRLADRLQADQCMDLLLKQLADMAKGVADVQLVIQVHTMPPSAASRPAAQGIFVICKAVVQQQFCNVPTVINNEKLRRWFCKLPFAAVLSWAESSDLEVHSENCVVCLLTAWVTAQQAAGAQLSAVQSEQLAHQVRVLHLGPAYQHHVLPNLQWFKGCSSFKYLPALLAHKGMSNGQAIFPKDSLRICIQWKGAAKWVAAPRKQCSTGNGGSLMWQLDAAQLRLLCLDHRLDGSSHQVINGFPLRLYLQPFSSTSKIPSSSVGLFCQVKADAAAALGLPWSDAAIVTVGEAKFKSVGPAAANGFTSSQFGLIGHNGWGFFQFFPAASIFIQSVPSVEQALAPYTLDGQLHIEAAIKYVDTL